MPDATHASDPSPSHTPSNTSAPAQVQRRRVRVAAVAALGAASLGAALAAVAAGGDDGPFDADRFLEHVKVLSSDAFEGRAPASPGEARTLDYLTKQFAAIGLAAAGDEAGESYLQPVPLVEITAAPDASLDVSDAQGDYVTSLAYGSEAVLWTKRVVESVTLEASEMVFVGYGIVAPEYGWNDYADVDVRGKTVVVLVNDPGFASGDEELFRGRAMTWYGRWPYKYEEAARQGAAAALIVHEAEPAAYPWEVVRNSWTGPQFDLQGDGDAGERLAVEGWITEQSAGRLFNRAGFTYAQAKAMALNRDFRAIPLQARASATLSNSVRRSDSYNVIGRLRGSAAPAEHVVFMAHWDHLGLDPSLEDDQIYNGAVDNATGVAGLLELARVFAEGPRPRRSILFMAVTAEEAGLLGSRHYAEHPVVPPAQTVAAINIDAMNVDGPTRDVVVVGYGQSELEDYLREAAREQGRRVIPEQTPEHGSYYRSDHFNFAKIGVPALFAESGLDYVGRDSEWGVQRSQEYLEQRYHKPADEYDPAAWDVAGALRDLELYLAIGRRLVDGEEFPQWYEWSEFRGIRTAGD